MTTPTNYELYTMTMVQDGDRVLLINRPASKGFPGFLAPGGKVEFAESIVDSAIREVYEETGLVAKEITYKGMNEFCDPSTRLRYMVFNYLVTAFEGELLEHPPEGELHWVHMNEVMDLPMQPWFREKFAWFFEPGTFEKHVIWDRSKNEASNEVMMWYR